jgi:menaquinone reductase, molybdopterin-binding-like subunit
MSKKFNRRDIIKLVGGGIAGMALTPIPWKLLDDLSIWTQNWSWIPVPLKGEINSRYSICTICPAGCAIRARCVSGHPVSVWGIKDHPVNGGALCPLGLGGHHLAYHPARLRTPVKLVNNNNKILTYSISPDEIISLIGKNIADSTSNGSEDLVAVLDNRPERSISYAYRSFLSGLPNGRYISSGSEGLDSLEGLYDIADSGDTRFGFNPEKAKTIVSFGTPLLEGWGIPGRVLKAMKNGFKLVQIETRFSHTASIADRWLPAKPGTEAILALGLAHIMLHENLTEKRLDSYKKLTAKYSPGYVADITGINQDLIRATALEMVHNSPSLVLCGREPAGGPFSREEQIAIWGLNLLLDNIGPDKCIVTRRPLPAADMYVDGELAPVTKLSNIPDHSIRVLIIDDAESGNAVPWQLIEWKLVPDRAFVISLSPYLVGLTKRADYVIPAPTYLESYQDIPTSFDAQTATYAVSAPLYTPPETVTEPAEFLRLLAQETGTELPEGTYLDMIKQRAGNIYRQNRGWIYTPHNGRLIETAGVFTEQQFWNHLSNGGYWIDEPLQESVPVPGTLFSDKLESALPETIETGTTSRTDYPLTLVPFGWRGAVDSGPVTPLISKLYQESEFREGTNRALLHPKTGRLYGLRDGSSARITTQTGELIVRVELSDCVMPDVVHVALGPDQDSITGVRKVKIQKNVLSVCTPDIRGTWRTSPARIETV